MASQKNRPPTDSASSGDGADDSLPVTVVGLGASAGGLEAIEKFFQALPPDNGMAFVVVMHHAEGGQFLLPELLARVTSMEVASLKQTQSVAPNRIYVLPPGMNVDLDSGELRVSKIPRKHAAPLPIDYFFGSLAVDRGELAIGLVFSGTGSDGTLGASAIKAQSGLVMVQSLESSKYPGMPQSVIDAQLADCVAAPDEIPQQLLAHVSGENLLRSFAPSAMTQEIDDALPEILQVLRRRCGHDFAGYKPSTICRRIQRRMNMHQLRSPQNYLRFLHENKLEAATLFDDLLIGVTHFFRDPEVFEHVSQTAMLDLLEKCDSNTLRVWVPGCATGEEAYSIAMLLRESIDALQRDVRVQIFGTDLSLNAINFARKGAYPLTIEQHVSSARLSNFFHQEADRYRIRKELRDCLVFAQHNVLQDPPFTKVNLISCRNLMIYLQPNLQKRLLSLFHYAIAPGGYLLLGTSDSIGDLTQLYRTADAKTKLFQRNDSSFAENSHFDTNRQITRISTKEAASPIVHKNKPMDQLKTAVNDLLVETFAPPTVIVNGKGTIVYVHGRTGQFLELSPGGPPKSITTMARQGLELDLSSALRDAAQHLDLVTRKNIQVQTNGGYSLVNLSVQQIATPESLKGLLRVSFQIVEATLEFDTAGETTTGSRPREQELEKELKHTRESLQHSIEQLDGLDEEMTSSNEELQSTNEELQSTNEELETSKEELQSLNEELETVNAEYKDKIRQLSHANDDMQNLLNSTDIATIFLDKELCIKSFTEQAKHIIRLIPSDAGRPLSDLTSHLQNVNLVADAKEVLRSLVFRESEVRTEDNRWLLLRMLPYRTSEDKIDGLVITFTDIDELKRTQGRILRARNFAESIVETIREPLLVLDEELRVRVANQAFYQTFRLTQDETIGILIFDLGSRLWNLPQLRKLLKQVLTEHTTLNDFELNHEFPGVGFKKMLLNARCIPDSDEEKRLILLAFESVAP